MCCNKAFQAYEIIDHKFITLLSVVIPVYKDIHDLRVTGLTRDTSIYSDISDALRGFAPSHSQPQL
jgi:hypothetical protein